MHNKKKTVNLKRWMAVALSVILLGGFMPESVLAVTCVQNQKQAAASVGTFAVTSIQIKNAIVTGIKTKTWTGKAITQTPVVKVSGKTLKKGTDYTISYSGNVRVGTAKMTIRGKGQYTGALQKTFTIRPKTTAVTKLTGGVKQFTVTWKKQTAQTTGYQIQYSTSSTFKTGAKTTSIGSVNTVSKKLTGLKASTTYYVRVRTYKTVSSKKIYSAWSAVKSVKTKAAAAASTGGSSGTGSGSTSSSGDTKNYQYIANKSTKKFHRSSCSAVNKMSEKNKWYADCSRSELIKQGYDACKICKP